MEHNRRILIAPRIRLDKLCSVNMQWHDHMPSSPGEHVQQVGSFERRIFRIYNRGNSVTDEILEQLLSAAPSQQTLNKRRTGLGTTKDSTAPRRTVIVALPEGSPCGGGPLTDISHRILISCAELGFSTPKDKYEHGFTILRLSRGAASEVADKRAGRFIMGLLPGRWFHNFLTGDFRLVPFVHLSTQLSPIDILESLPKTGRGTHCPRPMSRSLSILWRGGRNQKVDFYERETSLMLCYKIPTPWNVYPQHSKRGYKRKEDRLSGWISITPWSQDVAIITVIIA